MVLQYWGYKLSPEELFRHIFGGEHEDTSHDAQIGIGNLAQGVLSLTQLKARLYSMEVYEKLKARISSLTPFDVLRANLDKDIPCIVRLPSHYNVAIGYDTERGIYIFNEPSGGVVVERTFEAFKRGWSDRSPFLPYDSRYLILAVNP